MTTARDIMTPQAHTVGDSASLVEAATLMRDHGVGALPVTSDDGALAGIITDRDIVVNGVAASHDVGAVAVGTVTQGIVSTVSPDEDVDRVVGVMGDQQIKRLVVVDGHDVVGMISESDLARSVDEDKIVDFVKRVYGRS
ncbi:CBS domain-containing protein [Serinicoccus marinus]|uniref:CBS domain-containing protein n=1 Tax=Serinicoccus marinus TaxID=247333 RepID=UPI0003B3A34D|nr:CBS domain-containing protein [Serinicoccus marinus]